MVENKEQLKIVSKELKPGIWELQIEGSLDWSNFSRVESSINEIFQKGIYRLVINLRDTTYISSAGFGCFISSLDVAMKHNGNLIFAATPPEIQDVFDILGLSKILQLAKDEAEAIQQFP